MNAIIEAFRTWFSKAMDLQRRPKPITQEQVQQIAQATNEFMRQRMAEAYPGERRSSDIR